MTKPVRIQLSRKRGFKLQAHSKKLNGLPAVVVSRPSKFGNPFTFDLARALHPGEPENILRARCVEAFRAYVGDIVPIIQDELRGKNLACWCPLVDEHGKPVPCHADVLLEIANQ